MHWKWKKNIQIKHITWNFYKTQSNSLFKEEIKVKIAYYLELKIHLSKKLMWEKIHCVIDTTETVSEIAQQTV